MQTPRLSCVLFPDLHPWERHVFEVLTTALAQRMPLQLHEAQSDLRATVRQIRHHGPGPVWLLARHWRQAARKLSRLLPSDYPVLASALDVRPEPVSLPGLFWGALKPRRAEVFRVLAHNAFAYRSLHELERVTATRLNLLPLPMAASYAHRAPDFPPRPVAIGVLGAFHSENNLHFALNIAHYVSQRRKDLKVRLVGNGPLLPHLETCVRELGLTGVVELVESERPWIGLDLDLLLYAPLRASHHIPLLMAAAGGIPALCGEVYGIEELIQDSRDGFILPINETKPFGELVLRMVADPALRNFFGGKLREKLMRDYAPDSVAEKYASYFHSLTGASQTTRPAEVAA